MSKQLVQYRNTFELTNHGNNILTASLYALNHPRLGKGIVRTSIILNIDFETGIIETLNTFYCPSSPQSLYLQELAQNAVQRQVS